MASGLIIGGKTISCSKPVSNWNDHGMKFKVGQGARIRKDKIKNIVLHWTAGEGDGKRVFDILNQRKLGIDFHIDPQGNISQFSDPIEIATFGQGVVNNFSVGIEMSNYGFGNPIDKHRIVKEQILKGRKIQVASFYDAQMESMFALVSSLAEALSIPKTIPGSGNAFKASELNPTQIAAFSGVIGHINIPDTTKVDPGIQPFDYLLKHGFTLTEIV